MPKSRADFVRMTLTERRRKEAAGLVKIVRASEGTFLSEWAFEDIAREPWGLPARRPMVYMSDPQETIEKAMWCYERGVVPAVGESAPEIAAATAHAYGVDALIADGSSALKLLPHIDRSLEWITIADSQFDVDILAPLAARAHTVRLVLCLPEVGAIAETALCPAPRFAPVEGCTVVRKGAHYCVTKQAPLVTPIADYWVELAAAVEHA